MWIKICANTNLEDAKAAAHLGANAVGFVFAASKRKVTAVQVAAIVAGLPENLEKIGVFDSQDAAEIVGIVRATSLTGVQLHGGFDLKLTRRLREQLSDDIAIIQTLHWNVEGEAANADEVSAQLKAIAGEPAIDRVLIDSKTVGGSGGTGVSFDWKAAQARLSGSGVTLIVAGGLRPENVAEAIGAFAPWGVDVASGVEALPGRKDHLKLERFIDNARAL